MVKHCAFILLLFFGLLNACPSLQAALSAGTISPTLGPAGQWVYVSGTDFVKDATTVDVGGVTNISANVYSPTMLGFRLPTAATGTTLITVRVPGASVTTSSTYTVGIPMGLPTASLVSPLVGPPGQWIHIVGTNFVHGQTSISFGGLSDIAAHVYGPTSLGFRVPQDAAGIGTVKITTIHGETTTSQMLDTTVSLGAPTISALSTSTGSVGNAVTVTGSRFVPGYTTVSMGGVTNIPANVTSASTLQFSIPTAATGATPITVVTLYGSVSSSQMFVVTVPAAAPTITSFTPTMGPVGQWIYVRGSGYIAGQTWVSVAGVSNIATTYYHQGEIGFRLPENATGSTVITLTTPHGTAVSAQNYTVGVPTGVPTFTRMTPNLGPVGQWISVIGTNFVAGQTTVSIGGLTGIVPRDVTPTSFGFWLPAGATGSTSLVITTPNGIVFSSSNYTVGVPTEPPTTVSLRPTTGPVSQWVSVHGTNFVFGQTTITMGGVAGIAANVYSPTELGFRVPATAVGSTTVQVVTPNGETTTTDVFTVGPPTSAPTIANFTPALAQKGDTVTVTGTNFIAGGTVIAFAGRGGIATIVSNPTTLSFLVPTGVSGVGPLMITTTQGSATSVKLLTVAVQRMDPPAITNVSPLLGPVGQTVQVSGANFVPGETLVKVGGIASVLAGVSSGVSLSFVVPAGASGTSAIEVSTPYGSVLSSQLYTVGVPIGAPTIASFSPSLGPVGNWIQLRGSNFVSGQTTASVGGISGVSVHVYRPDAIGFAVPIGATGTGRITVTTPHGAATSTQNFTIGTPTAPPTITGFSEHSSEDWVYIKGTEFVFGQTQIKLDNEAPISAYVYGPDQLGFKPSAAWKTASQATLTTPNGSVVRVLRDYFPLTFDLDTAFTYQIQSSTNLTTWANEGAPIEGQDAAYRLMTDMKQGTSRFFRIQRTPRLTSP